MPTRLAARVLEVQYKQNTAAILSQVSLTLDPHVFTGVVGPNGSGKSTLIRALSRTLKPAGGVVLLDERDLYSEHSARTSARAISVMPQNAQVSLDFSVREVVRMGRAPHLPPRPFAAETRDDEQIVSEALEAAQVDDLAERLVSSLSGGERQRVLFARALAQQADVLLLDEPTASLDLRHQAEILTLARRLAHDGGATVLAVLHDLNLAAEYCDRLVLLQEGCIAAMGSPAAVLTPETLLRVYGVRVWVRPHPVSGRPLVLTLPERLAAPGFLPALPRVHVVSGGGTGAGLLVTLHDLGFPLTAGALHDGDPDAAAAQMLGIPFALESSFSLLSEAAQAEAAQLAQSAEVVLLTDVPFGQANLSNLEAVLTLRREGKSVVCLQEPAADFLARDFTGKAAALWSALLVAGAKVLTNPVAVLEHLKQWSVKGE